MKTISNDDYSTIIRVLRWAAVQGGCSTIDANKRRQCSKLLKKYEKSANK